VVISRRWFRHETDEVISIPEGESIPAVFLRQVAVRGSKIAVADVISGSLSYRKVAAACMLLKPVIEKMPGSRTAIMLPASAVFCITYLAVQFAGRVPVILNFSTGPRNLREAVGKTGTERILTSRRLAERLAFAGMDLSGIDERFVYVEDLLAGISLARRVLAALAARFSLGGLSAADVPRTAAILFTSGSEAVPKAVPLTQGNILSNLHDVLSVVKVHRNDRLAAILPPFHSLGLTGNVGLVLCGGISGFFCPDPLDSRGIARLIEACGATAVIGTPAFLAGLADAAAGTGRLESLRLVITGAEACPPPLYEKLNSSCPDAAVLEGYGTTECSPIISINHQDNLRPGTIGLILPSLECLILDRSSREPLTPPAEGVLLVRGPSVFEGYLNGEASPPFVEVGGRKWYETGDVVSIDSENVLTFRARLKRFTKIGGEMISLPAIEAALQGHLSSGHEALSFAVEASQSSPPELVLFTTTDIGRETANKYIRLAGLSGLHNIRRVIRLRQMPVLATGKIDYPALRRLYLGGGD
jgi:long-chain-fatty-acid--[acyl-carrier-protein] ligase